MSQGVIWKDRKRIMGLPITFTKYSMTNDKIYINKGFLNTVEDEMLMYRIMDIKLSSSLMDKIFGVGNILLHTADKSHPILMITKVKDAKKVKDNISKRVEEARSKLNIRGRELYGVSDMDGEYEID